jgi:phosphoglycolate phosphatase-like HAD superfamily hydrolase
MKASVRTTFCARFEVLVSRLTEEARRVTGNGVKFFEVLPGVRNVASARGASALSVSARDRQHQTDGLFEDGTGRAGQFFTLPGAFGDESHNRRDLPARAAERIRKHLQLDLAPEQFIVIGDTPNDIDCARHFGARAVAVGTGRTYSREEILACKPRCAVARSFGRRIW